MKEGSLFVSYETYRTGMDASDCVLGFFGKLLMDGWRLGSMTFGLVIQKFLNIE
jgi:hypothetical protein